MSHQITVTGKTGPGSTETALVITDVQEVHFDLARLVLQVVSTPARKVSEMDLSGVTTVTCSVSSNVYTFAVS